MTNIKVRVARGFSLIELMITLALLMIILGLGFGTISFMNRLLMRSEIDQLYATCMYAQRCAQITHEQQTIEFDIKHKKYSYNGFTHQLPPQIRFGFMPGIKGPPASPQTLLTEPITFKNQCITFAPHGIIQSGTVYLVDRSNSVLYALSSPIAQFSYLRRYRYNGAWQLIV